MNMIKVMFATASLGPGGAERHTVSLANRMADRGHECHAMYVKSRHVILDRLHLRNTGTVRCLEAARYFDMRAIKEAARHMAAVEPSAVLAANPYALMYSWIAMRMARVRAPIVVTYHSTRLLTSKEQLQMIAYRPLFWTADCTVFVSRNQMRHCVRRGVLSRRNEVIHNGVDTEYFRSRSGAEERAAERTALGLADDDYVIGIVAHLRPEKNHMQLVDAVAALRGMGIRARALIVGDGQMRAAIEARARARNIESHVIITGFRKDVRPLVAACDAIALCSTGIETFSLAALEAMALGKPVVHSELGGASEMVFPGWNGYLFPVGDTEAFVSRLAALSDRAVAEKMGRNARTVVETLFSEKAMVDRYEGLLIDLARKPLSARPAPVS